MFLGKDTKEHWWKIKSHSNQWEWECRPGNLSDPLYPHSLKSRQVVLTMVSLAYYKVFCKTHCSLRPTDNSSECLFIFLIWSPRGLWKHRTARATCFVILFIWGAVWHFIPKSQFLTKDTCISIWILWDLQPLVRDGHPMKNTHSGLSTVKKQR